MTAALHHGNRLWIGTERNIGQRLRLIADDLGIEIHVAKLRGVCSMPP